MYWGKWINREKCAFCIEWGNAVTHTVTFHCSLSGQSHFCSRGTTSTQQQTLKVLWSYFMQRLAQRNSTDSTGGLLQRLRQEKSLMCSDTTLLWVYLCIVTEVFETEYLALVFKKKPDPGLFPLNWHLPTLIVNLLGILKVLFFYCM